MCLSRSLVTEPVEQQRAVRGVLERRTPRWQPWRPVWTGIAQRGDADTDARTKGIETSVNNKYNYSPVFDLIGAFSHSGCVCALIDI